MQCYLFFFGGGFLKQIVGLRRSELQDWQEALDFFAEVPPGSVPWAETFRRQNFKRKTMQECFLLKTRGVMSIKIILCEDL